MIADLERLRVPSPDVAAWFRTALAAAFSDLSTQERQQRTALAKRQSELKGMQDRLLNAFLAGTIDEPTFKAKSGELQYEAAKVNEAMDRLGDFDPARGDAALAIFDWSQNAAEIWRGSNNDRRREILDSVCLNRTVSDVSLVPQVAIDRPSQAEFSKLDFCRRLPASVRRAEFSPVARRHGFAGVGPVEGMRQSLIEVR